jgi:hypothetical protein
LRIKHGCFGREPKAGIDWERRYAIVPV